tara:strand:+ start:2058 stop:2693 length:636 start_codon:yes stop_codon:yes gene_type:complete
MLDSGIWEVAEPLYRKIVLDGGLSTTKPGSLKHWLSGKKQPSLQSKVIKLGKFGEKLFAKMVEINPRLELLPHGIIDGIVEGKKKDIDLLFCDPTKKIVYYYELKANINLDTEKLPATIEKVKMIEEYLKKEYPDHEIKSAILNWSVFSEKVYEEDVECKSLISKIKKFERAGCSVEFPESFVKIVDFQQLNRQQFELLGQELNQLAEAQQ